MQTMVPEHTQLLMSSAKTPSKLRLVKSVWSRHRIAKLDLDTIKLITQSRSIDQLKSISDKVLRDRFLFVALMLVQVAMRFTNLKSTK
jgi:hypothetical protein